MPRPAPDYGKPSSADWRQQLRVFQAQEIERAKQRLQKACNGGQMKPEVADYILKNMEGIYRALRRLDALEQRLAAEQRPDGNAAHSEAA